MGDQVIDLNPISGGRREIIIKQISWAAIFSGVLVALGVAVLFLTFGFFIGFRLSPRGASAWSIIWTFVGAFFSLFLGGWVAARLGGNPANGRSHGLVTWGLTTVTTFIFLTLLSWGVVSQSLGVVRTAALAASNLAPVAAANANRMGIPSRSEEGRMGTASRSEADRMAGPQAEQQAEQQANQTLNQAQTAWPYAARVLANKISNASLLIWLTFLIAAAGALVGGAAGAPRVIPSAEV